MTRVRLKCTKINNEYKKNVLLKHEYNYSKTNKQLVSCHNLQKHFLLVGQKKLTAEK